MNIIAVRTQDKDRPDLLKLVKATFGKLCTMVDVYLVCYPAYTSCTHPFGLFMSKASKA